MTALSSVGSDCNPPDLVGAHCNCVRVCETDWSSAIPTRARSCRVAANHDKKFLCTPSPGEFHFVSDVCMRLR